MKIKKNKRIKKDKYKKKEIKKELKQQKLRTAIITADK